MTATLLALVAIFAQLSLLAFGGGNTILPEMQRQVVDVHQWMSAQDFSALFALAQAAPGPNLMLVSLVGWHVAGVSGVMVTSIAMFGPSSLLMVLALRVWQRHQDSRWLPRVRAALVPVTVGLVAASAALICIASDQQPVLLVITLVCALLAFKTRLHPIWLLLAGGVVGYSGLGLN